MHVAKKNVDLFYTLKRKARAGTRRRRARLRARALLRAKRYRNARSAAFGNQSLIASMLCANVNKALHMPQTSLVVRTPQIFSMLTAPEDVIELVAQFALTHRTRPISDVYVDFSRIEAQDLGAHALLDKLVDEIVAYTLQRRSRLQWKGNFPLDPAKQRFIRAMGIIKQLGATHHYLNLHDASKIVLFERRCRHYINTLKGRNPLDKTEQANAAQRFVNHVNGCLAKEGRQLTQVARGLLCSYVVEIIDNAENHAGMVDWTIQGYLDVATEQPECEIVIFNFGQSIAETLKNLVPGSYTSLQVEQYLKIHQEAGSFATGWRREDLLTLLALQGSISSKNTIEDPTRGQGTADLIEFFQAMNHERQLEDLGVATMYIVSGSTRILFDGSYRMQRGEGNSRTIAFNASNDLRLPPDPSAVKPLRRGSLPGTMIGIKFPIQASNLQAKPPSEGHAR